MPGDELRRADEVERRRRQRRHVQRLADVASRVRTLGVFVQESCRPPRNTTARRKPAAPFPGARLSVQT